jgi:serine/threonine protein kinase
MLKDLENELRVHWALTDCEGILQLRGLYEDNLFVYLVLDYQPGGSLLDHILKKEKFTEHQARLII